MRPPVLLLDEPLAALDLKLRQAMQEELRRIHREIGGTFVFVTHDQGEAMNLANRIAVMNDGSLIQVSSTLDIYRNPNSEFVATFVGDANVLEGQRRGGIVELACGARFDHAGRDGPVVAVVRPESISLSEVMAAEDATTVVVSGTLDQTIFMGPAVRCQLRLEPSGKPLLVHAPASAAALGASTGARLAARWPAGAQTILDR